MLLSFARLMMTFLERLLRSLVILQASVDFSSANTE
jgi:hypothetical protein